MDGKSIKKHIYDILSTNQLHTKNNKSLTQNL